MAQAGFFCAWTSKKPPRSLARDMPKRSSRWVAYEDWLKQMLRIWYVIEDVIHDGYIQKFSNTLIYQFFEDEHMLLAVILKHTSKVLAAMCMYYIVYIHIAPYSSKWGYLKTWGALSKLPLTQGSLALGSEQPWRRNTQEPNTVPTSVTALGKFQYLSK